MWWKHLCGSAEQSEEKLDPNNCECVVRIGSVLVQTHVQKRWGI